MPKTPRIWALVSLSTMIVMNVEQRTTEPPSLTDFNWINEDEFAAEQVPAVGRIWNGQIPASFADPAVSATGDLAEMSAAELLTELDVSNARTAEITAALNLNLGG